MVRNLSASVQCLAGNRTRNLLITSLMPRLPNHLLICFCCASLYLSACESVQWKFKRRSRGYLSWRGRYSWLF